MNADATSLRAAPSGGSASTESTAGADSQIPCWCEVFSSQTNPESLAGLENALREAHVRFVLSTAPVATEPPVIVVKAGTFELATTLIALGSVATRLSVLAVGRATDRAWVRAAMGMGVIGIVDEDEGRDALIARVTDVSRGISVLPVWLCRELGGRLHDEIELTTPERAVLVAVASHRTLVDAAANLNYSERHVRRLLAGLRQRFGVDDRAGLLIEAHSRGLV